MNAPQSTDLLLQRALDNCTQDPDTWTVLYRDEALAMAKEIHQLRLDLAQQTANATAALQAQHERDCAVEEVARLRAALEDIASGSACVPGYSGADAGREARGALHADVTTNPTEK